MPWLFQPGVVLALLPARPRQDKGGGFELTCNPGPRRSSSRAMGAALQHEVGGDQRDGAGELDVEVRNAIAVDVAGDGGDAAGDGVVQLAGDAGVGAAADEAEGLVAGG